MSKVPVRMGIIGGSGLGEKLGAETGELVRVETPFGPPSAPVLRVRWADREIFLLLRHGAGHEHNPTAVPYRANIFALKALGVTHVLASGATGSLREPMAPGDLVLVDQVIDRTRHRPGSFFERAAVHVEFADPMCPVMRRWLAGAADRLGDAVRVHRSGTYVCMEGPAFSTRAESEMHRRLGGDLIGMTAMPEAKLAREAEMAYALVAMPTDYDCWRPHPAGVAPQALLAEIVGNLHRATEANLRLMRAALDDLSLLEAEPSPAHRALELAIWSDKSRIDRDERMRLQPIWGQYLDQGG